MWIRQFVHFHKLRHPREMGAAEIEAYLRHLANDRAVSSSTHNQALSALLVLYGAVLDVKLPWLGEIKRPKRPRRLPVVLTRDELHMILAHLDGTQALMARLMYGTGMRLWNVRPFASRTSISRAMRSSSVKASAARIA
jgi:integrase